GGLAKRKAIRLLSKARTFAEEDAASAPFTSRVHDASRDPARRTQTTAHGSQQHRNDPESTENSPAEGTILCADPLAETGSLIDGRQDIDGRREQARAGAPLEKLPGQLGQTSGESRDAAFHAGCVPRDSSQVLSRAKLQFLPGAAIVVKRCRGPAPLARRSQGDFGTAAPASGHDATPRRRGDASKDDRQRSPNSSTVARETAPKAVGASAARVSLMVLSRNRSVGVVFRQHDTSGARHPKLPAMRAKAQERSRPRFPGKSGTLTFFRELTKSEA
ncbi:hypothetical protein HPB47_016297, partial [Ixodes persulcatus]